MAVDLFQRDSTYGDLYVVDGISDVARWDGFLPAFERAGMLAPTAAVVLGDSGTGAIVGTYFAYERFVDSQGNFSDLSPISAEFTASGSSGTITGVSTATPLVATSASHGLATGAWVKIEGVGGIDGANNTWQITVIDANSFSLDESASDGITPYTGGGTWISGVASITYSSVQVPTEAKVVRRQLLRSTDGQAITFYVDVDTTDLLATSFSSSLTDDLLSSGVKVPLLDDNGGKLADSNGPPPNYYKGIAAHLDRMFMAGLLEYTLGSCSVAFGSATVTGAGTGWKTTFAGRFLYIDGATRAYEILSVDEAAQTITLAANYADSTDLFSFYNVKPAPAYRRLVAFSGAGRPQSWLATDAFPLQETGDEIVGPFQMGAYLYIAEKAHIHKMTFQNSPITDGAVFMTAFRGAVNPRCIVLVDNTAYCLDELGVYKFKGNADVEPISLQIQPIFRNDTDCNVRIQWRFKEFFHGILDKQRETIRWFVCLDGNRYPRHALAYQHRINRWWVEKYPFPVGGAAGGYLDGFLGRPQVFYGGQHAKILAAWTGTLDLADPGQGDVRGSVVSGTAFGLTDSAAVFGSTGLLNAPLEIISGTGKGQVRRIVAVASGAVTVDMPWKITPDSTSVYQIGGIHFSYKGNWSRLSRQEISQDRRWEMLFEEIENPSSADLRFFSNFSETPDVQEVTVASDDGGGIASTAGEAAMPIDLTTAGGLVDKRIVGSKEQFIRGKRFFQYSLEGATNLDQVKIFGINVEGVESQEG